MYRGYSFLNCYMKTLYLDIGNSFLKLAELKGTGWEVRSLENAESLVRTASGLRAEEGESFRIIASSVRRDVAGRLNQMLAPGQLVVITSEQVPAEFLDYDTPETLGIDRYLACLGASAETGKSVIVVDAGTACTIDLMTENRIYKGGVIMPGLQVFHTAMKSILPELPVVSESVPNSWPGKSTEDSIRWGVNGSFFQSVEWFIRKHFLHSREAEVFITGGNAESLKEYLEERMQIHYKPYLVFDGMYEFWRMMNDE